MPEIVTTLIEKILRMIFPHFYKRLAYWTEWERKNGGI